MRVFGLWEDPAQGENRVLKQGWNLELSYCEAVVLPTAPLCCRQTNVLAYVLQDYSYNTFISCSYLQSFHSVYRVLLPTASHGENSGIVENCRDVWFAAWFRNINLALYWNIFPFNFPVNPRKILSCKASGMLLFPSEGTRGWTIHSSIFYTCLIQS